MVQEVQVLNKKIENINIQRTKAEAKVDMLKKQLLNEITAYKKAYGVDLSDKNFSKLSGKVKAELSTVSDELKKEYDLKEKVVNCIEAGNYDEAYQLLGIEKEDTKAVDEKIENKGTDTTVSSGVELDFGIITEDKVVGGTELDFGVEDDGTDVSDVEMTVEDDDEPVVKSTNKVKGQGALDAAGSMEVLDMGDETPIVEDEIPSMDDNDWGFGDILSGSQFQN